MREIIKAEILYKKYVIIIFLVTLFSITPTYSNNKVWEYIGHPKCFSINSFSFNKNGDIFTSTWWYPSDGLLLDAAKNNIERSTDNGKTWNTVFEGEYAIVNITVNKDGHIYATTWNKIYKSIDNGDTWEIINSELPVSFIHTIAISPEGNLFIGTNPDNYFSIDGGYNWIKLELPNQACNYLFYSDSIIFAGVHSGYFPNPSRCIYRSLDNGNTWKRVLYTEKTFGWSIVENSKGHIFASISGSNKDAYGGVYRSTDCGETWTQINNGFPDWSVSSIVIDSNDNILAALNGYGVYRSIDNGENWTEFNNGLSDLRAIIFGINNKNEIFLGTTNDKTPPTEGGNIFKIATTTSVNEISNTAPNSFILWQNYPNPFNPSTKIKLSVPYEDYVSLKIYNILGQEITTLFSGKLPSGQYEFQWNAQDLPSGIYFCRFQSRHFIKTIKMILLN